MIHPYSENPIIHDIELFRDQLWKLCRKNAEGLTGPEVAQVLESITDDIYYGTIDEAYDNTNFKNRDSLASLWDCIWISTFARRLLSVKNKKKKDEDKA